MERLLYLGRVPVVSFLYGQAYQAGAFIRYGSGLNGAEAAVLAHLEQARLHRAKGRLHREAGQIGGFSVDDIGVPCPGDFGRCLFYGEMLYRHFSLIQANAFQCDGVIACIQHVAGSDAEINILGQLSNAVQEQAQARGLRAAGIHGFAGDRQAVVCQRVFFHRHGDNGLYALRVLGLNGDQGGAVLLCGQHTVFNGNHPVVRAGPQKRLGRGVGGQDGHADSRRSVLPGGVQGDFCFFGY